MKSSPFLFITSSVPLATYSYILLLGGAAYLLIGHWPSYSNPDPKTLPIASAVGLVNPLLTVAILLVLAYPVATLLKNGWECVRENHFWIFSIGMPLWVTDFLFFKVVGGRGLLEWILD